MGKGGGGGGICQVISRYIDGLHGGDGSLLGGGDPLLHSSHVGGEGGLVADSRGDTAQQGRHLGTGLCESEDVVDEEQHVLSLLVPEVLGDGEAGPGPGAGGLVHLAVDEGDL